MALSAGSRLGVYEILSVIGEGGMGRVYRARDTKLHREVAIKVLPEDVAGDPERVARFEREARTLASLNHPHIAQIYGTEQSGGTHALVMELVEGEDLSQRIARGPIPWREAEPIAKQIAEALETAHEQGIVHRDLKPANIKITPDGVVKVLDFGLAKAVDATRETSPASATITSPAALTQAGFILGTAAYMSPEQAKGRPADKRSDVWAFGCVLYEMVTGKRAFPGDDVVEALAAVVRAEPDLAAVPADVPQAIRTLIARCLIKDRKQRVSDIAAARYALESKDSVAAPPAVQPSRNPWPGALVAAVAIIALAAVAMYRGRPATEAPPVIRSTIAAPDFGRTGLASLAISRQGTLLAYAAQGRVFIRRLSESALRPLQGSEGGSNPFFSYDGEWLGFFADGKLKKVPVSGGAAQVLADAPSGRGGSWGADGTIVFAPIAEGGIARISAAGGTVVTLTTVKPTERSHRWPHLLPDGRNVVFTIQLAGKLFDDAIIATVPIDAGEPTVVLEGGSGAQFVESGHLIYARAGNLLAIGFDPVAARASGAAITVLDSVRSNFLNGVVPVTVSSNGTLLYLQGQSVSASMSLLMASRTGETKPLLDRSVFNPSFRLSPDGKRVAVSINDGQVNIWIVELEGGGRRRFTLGAGSKSSPVWSPDGSRLYYLSNTGGTPRTVARAVDNPGSEDELTPYGMLPMTISPDGSVLGGRVIATTNFDVVTVDVSTKKSAAIASTDASESEPAFSPDGRYLAYQSDESGRNEVYVQEYPSGSRWQVTTSGASEPRWTSGGREIVYRNGTTLSALAVTPRPFSWSTPKVLFSIPNLFAFDVTADGQRFVIAQDSENSENVSFVLITGWFEELRAKMRPSR